jgi:glucosamine-6-phosphate deaminase
LVPAGDQDPTPAAARYDQEISRRGGFDLAVLGIGGNGHIAFNEPGSAMDSRTRVVELSPATVEQASAYWDDKLPIPDRAMTVGIGNLIESRRIVLLASGTTTAEALASALEGPIDSHNPASFLRASKGRLDVIADIEAASRLQRGTVLQRD